MKLIRTEDAVGHVLCHDITQIIVGETKAPVFRKGHVVTEEDIPVLLSVGKENLYIWEKQEGFLHENDAALVLAGLCGKEGMTWSPVREGKVDISAGQDGLFKVDVERLFEVNMVDEIMIATRKTNTVVRKGDRLAGTRIIPLVIDEKKLEEARKLAGDSPLLSIMPFGKKKAGIVTTGSEVYHGRIKDTFGPVIRKKLSEFDVEVLGQKIVNDDQEMIREAIAGFIEEGADMVFCTGGMSVDPDDVTPSAIRSTGAEVITYGSPVLPGAMFLLSYYNGSIPVVGLPGCVMYEKRSIFDLILPRLMADDKMDKKDIARLGHGGLCLHCQVCTFPNCGFGSSG